MKHTLTILAVAVMLGGCEDRKQVKRNEYYQVGGEYFSEIAIDSCEYIIISGHSITHKGNCSNPIHSPNHKNAIER